MRLILWYCFGMKHDMVITHASPDYELLDSGEGEKLERYGQAVIARPDPQALWKKSLSEEEWKKAQAVFDHADGKGKWKENTEHKKIFENWKVTFAGVTCVLKLSPFKHVGVFPEQSGHWAWLQELITSHLTSSAVDEKEAKVKNKISVLNLFGYTGGASVACALAGAEVTHVDASESAVNWSKANRDASGLPADAIRFIVDDARKFVEREIRRDKTYDIILLDPPVYGRGSNNELWKLEVDLVPLLSKIKKILSPKPLAILVNGYAAGYSHVAYKQVIAGITGDLAGVLDSGELAIQESHTDRLLPCGIFARWKK